MQIRGVLYFSKNFSHKNLTSSYRTIVFPQFIPHVQQSCWKMSIFCTCPTPGPSSQMSIWCGAQNSCCSACWHTFTTCQTTGGAMLTRVRPVTRWRSCSSTKRWGTEKLGGWEHICLSRHTFMDDFFFVIDEVVNVAAGSEMQSGFINEFLGTLIYIGLCVHFRMYI